MSLAEAQIAALLAPLDAGRVRQVQGNSHLEAWDVRRWLLRIFGWGGWQFDVVSCDLISERSAWDQANPLKGRHSVVYRVVGRLVLRDPEGVFVTSWEDGAVGDAQNQPSLGDAHDQALKTAMSQALKRCAVNIGEAGGLPLYNGGRTVPVVGKSIAHNISTTHDADESVIGGELDTVPNQPVPPVGSVEPITPNDAAPGSAPDPVESLPSGSGAEASADEMAAQTAQQVEHLREQAVALLSHTKPKEALQKLTRLQLDAGKHRLMNETVLSPRGAEMSLSVLFQEVLSMLSRAPQETP